MAATTELKKLQARKARLIKQNDLYRGDLLAEVDGLREASEWLDRGHSFYKAIAELGGRSPFAIFRHREKKNPISKLFGRCAVGFRFIRNLNR